MLLFNKSEILLTESQCQVICFFWEVLRATKRPVLPYPLQKRSMLPCLQQPKKWCGCNNSLVAQYASAYLVHSVEPFPLYTKLRLTVPLRYSRILLTAAWISTKMSSTAHSKHNVWSGPCRQIQKTANNCLILLLVTHIFKTRRSRIDIGICRCANCYWFAFVHSKLV